MIIDHILNSSFRDPSGFLFRNKGKLFRQINMVYKNHYDMLMGSGLYKKLAEQSAIIPHAEKKSMKLSAGAYKIIEPENLSFISYPYEWSFSQLKEAALITLRIQKTAFEYGMILKDASAYNIQFHNGKAILIDTLSFEKYVEGTPWVAYRQFCQHFLAPLSLMHYRDVRLNQLLRIFIDGIPLDLASKLLPARTKFKLSLLTHLHLHAKSQKRYASKAVVNRSIKISRQGLMGIIASLESTVRSLEWNPSGTEWAEYYEDTNYSDEGFQHKKKIIKDYLEKNKPKSLWDLGANTGLFSRIASDLGIFTVAYDIDPAAVEKNYRIVQSKKEANILPLVIDLTNPSPSMGWANRERMSLMERPKPDVVIALALIHHLAISNNVPFDNIARFFSYLCDHLIIEFVPKEDSQVQRLLASRDDIFVNYNKKSFEKTFSWYFKVVDSQLVEGSTRTIYLLKSKNKRKY